MNGWQVLPGLQRAVGQGLPAKNASRLSRQQNPIPSRVSKRGATQVRQQVGVWYVPITRVQCRLALENIKASREQLARIQGGNQGIIINDVSAWVFTTTALSGRALIRLASTMPLVSSVEGHEIERKSDTAARLAALSWYVAPLRLRPGGGSGCDSELPCRTRARLAMARPIRPFPGCPAGRLQHPFPTASSSASRPIHRCVPLSGLRDRAARRPAGRAWQCRPLPSFRTSGVLVTVRPLALTASTSICS